MTKNIDKKKISKKLKKPVGPMAHGVNRVPVSSKIIMEHMWWLGEALKADDEAAIARETAEIYRYSRMYHTFAGSPAKEPIKYVTPDEYPLRRMKNGKPFPDDDEADLD